MSRSSENSLSHENAIPLECQRLDNLPYDTTEIAVLEIARYFFLAFHVPQRCSWVAAFQYSEFKFGKAGGPFIAKSVLDTINAIRNVRRSGFNYLDPSCRLRSDFITPEESCLISALHDVRRTGYASQSDTFLLCESRDATHFGACTRALASAIDSVKRDLH